MRRHQSAELEHDLRVAAQRDSAWITAPPPPVHERNDAGPPAGPEAGQPARGEWLAPDLKQLADGRRAGTAPPSDLDDAGRVARSHGVGAASAGDDRPLATLRRCDPYARRHRDAAVTGEQLDVGAVGSAADGP